MRNDYKTLSKTLAYILRHATSKYNLTVDDNGWVSTEEVLKILRNQREEWKDLHSEDLTNIIAYFPRKRLEICINSIRALYGHSIDKKIIKTALKPPLVLYHGTSSIAADSICIEGLKPMNRQYVHLSAYKQIALEAGGRKSNSSILFEIDSSYAFKEGIIFYYGNGDTWLADYIPICFIKKI